MGMLSTVRARVALTLANVAQKIAAPGILKRARGLSGVDDSRGWFSLFSSGLARHVGFQTDTVVRRHDLVLAQCTVFACITLIAGDIGKLRAKLMEFLAGSGIWQETTSPAFSPVLRKPNRMQTWQQLAECWALSKLTHGNAYILKVRDERKVVVELYVLDPTRCRPLVSRLDGSVYYDIQVDDLSKVHEPYTGENALPASEVIHDRWNCLFHPLVGLSPLFACGLQASKALEIDENGTAFFRNASRPGGILTAPAEIADETAKRLKEYFETNFSGDNAGKVAVLGDGLTYTAMSVNPIDAQLIEQLQWTAKQVAAAFHVPAYLVGAADAPPNSSVEAQRRDYYDRCLQKLIEGIENTLDEGLGIGLGQPKDGKTYGVELDLDGLLRMDSTALTASLKDQVGAGITKPNEARRRLNLPPVTGGDTPYLQQQNYALSALAKRDSSADPFGTAKPEPAPAPPPAEPIEDEEAREEAAAAKAVAEALRADHQALERRLAAAELFVSRAAEMAAEVDETDEALHLLFRKAPEELIHG